MAQQKGWTVDVNQCTGCRACEAACKVEYELQIGQGRRRRVIERTEEENGKVRTFFTSLACNQCAEPACLKACPVGAYVKFVDGDSFDPVKEPWKRNTAWMTSTHGISSSQAAKVKGVVLHDPAKCIGCRRCEWACPYGAPQFNPDDKKIHKCEGCWQRTTATDAKLHSTRQVPACVATCIGGSIKWDDVNPVQVDLSDGDMAEWYDYDYSGASASDGVADQDGGGGGGDRQKFMAPGPLSATVFDGDGTTGTNKPVVPLANSGRGSSYVANWVLTKPALKIRNRVYQTRTGGWE